MQTIGLYLCQMQTECAWGTDTEHWWWATNWSCQRGLIWRRDGVCHVHLNREKGVAIGQLTEH